MQQLSNGNGIPTLSINSRADGKFLDEKIFFLAWSPFGFSFYGFLPAHSIRFPAGWSGDPRPCCWKPISLTECVWDLNRVMSSRNRNPPESRTENVSLGPPGFIINCFPRQHLKISLMGIHKTHRFLLSFEKIATISFSLMFLSCFQQRSGLSSLLTLLF